ALIAGSLLLFSGKRGGGGYRIDLGIILPGVFLTLVVVGFLTWNTVQRRRAPVRTGLAAMVGQPARVVDGFGSAAVSGRVQVLGEYWDAVGPAGIAPGDIVRIRRVEGRTVHVERRSE